MLPEQIHMGPSLARIPAFYMWEASETWAKQVICPCSHLSLYIDCSLTSTLVLFLPAEFQGGEETSALREEVAFLKEKVAGMERDIDGLEAIVKNLEQLKRRTENQLRTTENQLCTTENQLRTTENQLRTTENQLHTTENQLRSIIDVSSGDEPFHPSMEEDELVSTRVVCYCVVV